LSFVFGLKYLRVGAERRDGAAARLFGGWAAVLSGMGFSFAAMEKGRSWRPFSFLLPIIRISVGEIKPANFVGL
jgi:hypothetical protein